MQVAIVSDIHANRHAFEAVLADARDSPAQEIWCLGDVVGYGADPNDCCRLARRHADVCLAGNHDLAVTGDLDLGEFSTGAALAARWTQEVIDAGHRVRAPWRRGGRRRRGRVDPQPRQRRPAARRRRARGLAAARYQRLDRALAAGRVRHRRGGGRDPRRAPT